jgi:hypothetical protein
MSTFEQKLFHAIQPKRRRSPRQKTAERDRAYLAWMHTHGCLLAGKHPESPCSGALTVHYLRHVRHADGTIERTGRLDRRTLPLCQGHHQTGPQAVHRMTADHGREWERFFGVDSEQEVRRYNALFDRSDPECSCRLSGDHADASDCELHGVSRQPAVRLAMEESYGDTVPF